MTRAPRTIRLTKPVLGAMEAALGTVLFGDDFDGSNFPDLGRGDFERALEWVQEQLRRRGAP